MFDHPRRGRHGHARLMRRRLLRNYYANGRVSKNAGRPRIAPHSARSRRRPALVRLPLAASAGHHSTLRGPLARIVRVRRVSCDLRDGGQYLNSHLATPSSTNPLVSSVPNLEVHIAGLTFVFSLAYRFGGSSVVGPRRNLPCLQRTEYMILLHPSLLQSLNAFLD